MGRFIVVIRKPDNPVCYYLSRMGFRCYTAKNVAVFHKLADAESERDYFAPLMPEFRLSVEKLPPRVSVSRGILSAQPVG